ncbi:MAG: non-canonical purine NTP pyrophosphatase [Phycisphaerae bacterium]|jgi:adenylate kinase family enzyme/inosine/xanthosine triphosphate pyrophosphatase family protein
MFKLLFLTSNRTKLQHARYLCRNYDLRIVKQSNYGIAYEEPRTPNRDKLFKESIEDAKKRLLRQTRGKPEYTPLMPDNMLFRDIPLGLNKIFFIEDTSVKIHALSTDSNEVPGTDIKFWMKEHDFTSVDKLLKKHGNDRRVTVRSDVVLYLPKYLREGQDKNYKRFTSEAHGAITAKEYNFKTNELYPWLDNQSFNKWFVPRGCRRPISMLSIKEANKHDFRAGAFKDMLDFLEKERIISKIVTKKKKQTQKVLSFFITPSFLVCGLPCAGKTTLGEYLSKERGYYHIEASDFMYLSYYERHGINPTIKIADFAEKALKDTPSIVVDQTITHLAEAKDPLFIITGFRSPDEIEIFLKRYKGLNTVYPIFIDADLERRYQRNLKRNREGDIGSKKVFCDRDKQQLRMGLKEIKTKLRSKVIFNNSDFRSYFQSFLGKYPQVPLLKNKDSLSIPKERPSELEEAILVALLNEDQYFTTTEISRRINNCFPESKIKTNKNNVSRYFNQNFHPYYEINVVNNKIKYRLSPTGRSRAMFLLKRNSHYFT